MYKYISIYIFYCHIFNAVICLDHDENDLRKNVALNSLLWTVAVFVNGRRQTIGGFFKRVNTFNVSIKVCGHMGFMSSNLETSRKKYWVFAPNPNHLSTISLQWLCKSLIFQTIIWPNRINSLKYLRSKSSKTS